MGLAADVLWGLCDREFDELKIEWRRHQERQSEMLAVLRADLHNTAGKTFTKHFDHTDFMPGATVDVEARARELMAQGHPPAEAVAMACSKQSRRQNLVVLDKALDGAQRMKAKGRSNRARIPG